MGSRKSSPNQDESYLQHYLSVFGETRGQSVELIPPKDGARENDHLELSSIEFMEMTDEVKEKYLNGYDHPCWCNPELIYCDEARGNEVWLHKRPQ